jgi:hypothetical protein
MIEDFLLLPPVSTAPAVRLEQRISPRIFEKIQNGPYVILRGLGKLIHEENQKSKTLRHCPFKDSVGGWNINLSKISLIDALICELAVNKSQP